MADIYFTVLLIAEIFLYTFHFSMIILLFFKQNSTFKGAFYNIFRVVIVADLLSFLSIVINQKLPGIPEISTFYINGSATILPTIALNYAGFVVTLQFWGHTLMALNRFTFIWFPLKYQAIWRQHWYTFILFLLPFSRIFWQIQEFAVYKPVSNGGVSLEFISAEANQFFFGMSTVLYIITTCAAAILNFLSFIKFYFYKQTNSNLNVKEKHLLIVSFIVFIAQLWRTSYNISRLLFPTNIGITTFYSTILPVTYDLFALSGSLSLLALSKSTRKEYATFYFPKKYFKSHLIAASSSNPTQHHHHHITVIKD